MPAGLVIRVVADFTVLAAQQCANGTWEVTVRSTDGKAEPQVLGYWHCGESMVKDRLGFICNWHEEAVPYDKA